MILRARAVVPLRGERVENGTVAVGSGSDVLDLGDVALMPGLVNAHCHLDYTWLRGQIPRQETFTDWIQKVIAAKRTCGSMSLRADALLRASRAARTDRLR